MKSMSRILFMLVMAAVLATLPALKVNAQGDQCFGLSGGDCQLLQAAGGASSTAKLTSFVADYSLTFKVTGTGDDVDVKITGNGPISIDPTKLQGDMTSNPTAFFAALTLSNTISMSVTTAGKTESNNVEIRIVGDKVYFKDDQTTKGQWMWSSISGAMSGNPAIGSTLGSATGGAGAASQMMSDPAVMAALAKLPYAAGFIVAQRSADEDIGGEKSAHFVFNVNVLTLLKSPELKAAALALAQAAGQPTEEIETQLQQATSMGEAFLKDLKIGVHQYVGTTDQTLHGLGLDFSLKVDPATMGMLSGDTSSTSTTPVDLNFNFLVKLTKVGEKVTVEPVADAQEFKPNSQ
jgi:hypothetical protein